MVAVFNGRKIGNFVNKGYKEEPLVSQLILVPSNFAPILTFTYASSTFKTHLLPKIRNMNLLSYYFYEVNCTVQYFVE